jgi:hypothetical protein
MSPLIGSTGVISEYSYRGNLDYLPDDFSIGADVVDAPINTTITRTTTITGINYKAKVTPSSGSEISVNGASYTSTSQYVRKNQSVAIRYSPPDYETTYAVTLTVGKKSDTFNITTRQRPEDGIPNAFNFTDQTDIEYLKTNIESNIVTLSGMSNVASGQTPRTYDYGTASISGNSAQFKVTRNGTVVRDYGTGNYQVLNGDQIQLRMNAGGNSQTVSTTFSVIGTDTSIFGSPVTATVSDTWSLTTRYYPVSLSISASPGTVDYDNSSTISWNSENVELPIYIDGIGNMYNTSGSRGTGNLKAGAGGGSKTFTASATSKYSPPSNPTPASVTVNINPPPAPSVSLSADSTNISYNGSTTLRWSSSNATSVNSSTDNFAGSSTSGSVSTGNLTQPKTYTITVGGVEGQVSSPSSVTINVAAPPVPTVSLTADSTNISYNGSTTLRWSSSNATSVNSSTDNFAGSSTSGSVSTGNLTQPKTYTITVGGVEGQVSSPSSVTITVPEEPAIEKHITSNTTNVNASSYFGGDWGRNVRKKLYIDPGVVVGSTDPNTAALIISSGVVGAFTLINNGSIQGAPGVAGAANGGNGGKGGNAIRADGPGSGGSIAIENNGSVVAGGGGGGGGTKGGRGGDGGSGSYVVATYHGQICYREADVCAALQIACAYRDVSACLTYNAKGCTGNGVPFDCSYYTYETFYTNGGTGGDGGNGGAGGIGQGYNQGSTVGSSGLIGADNTLGGTNAGDGGHGAYGGNGGNGGNFGNNGDSGSQGGTGNSGTSGNVSGGTGGSTGSLPVGQGGISGYSLNGTNYTSISGGTVSGPQKSNP